MNIQYQRIYFGLFGNNRGCITLNNENEIKKNISNAIYNPITANGIPIIA